MAPRRKLLGFDDETLQAVELLSRDTGKTLQQLADEAFTDLLAKHHRPRTLKIRVDRQSVTVTSPSGSAKLTLSRR